MMKVKGMMVLNVPTLGRVRECCKQGASGGLTSVGDQANADPTEESGGVQNGELGIGAKCFRI